MHEFDTVFKIFKEETLKGKPIIDPYRNATNRLFDKGILQPKEVEGKEKRWFNFRDLAAIKLYCNLRKLRLSQPKARETMLKIATVQAELHGVPKHLTLLGVTVVRVSSKKLVICLRGLDGVFLYANDMSQRVIDLEAGDSSSKVVKLLEGQDDLQPQLSVAHVMEMC